MFETSVLRRRFGPKRDESDRRLEKLHTEELHNLYIDDMGRACSTNGGEEECI
jgi:hypothetical protein